MITKSIVQDWLRIVNETASLLMAEKAATEAWELAGKPEPSDLLERCWAASESASRSSEVEADLFLRHGGAVVKELARLLRVT